MSSLTQLDFHLIIYCKFNYGFQQKSVAFMENFADVDVEARAFRN